MTEYFIYFNKIFYNFFSFLTEYLVNLLFIILVSFFQSTVSPSHNNSATLYYSVVRIHPFLRGANGVTQSNPANGLFASST